MPLLLNDFFNSKDFKDLSNNFLRLTNAFFEDSANAKYVYMFLMILALLGTIGIFVYNAFIRERHTVLIPRWLMHAAPVILFSVFATFGLTGCFEELLPNVTVDGILYFTPNHIGSVSLITDENGVVVKRYKYKPYGELLVDKSSVFEEAYGKYMYTSQEYDSTSGLYYYNARFYDPEIGRFITPDSMVPDPTNTQDFNRYMYCSGNPVKYNDPTGHYDGGDWGDGWNGGPEWGQNDPGYSAVGSAIDSFCDRLSNMANNVKDYFSNSSDKGIISPFTYALLDVYNPEKTPAISPDKPENKSAASVKETESKSIAEKTTKDVVDDKKNDELAKQVKELLEQNAKVNVEYKGKIIDEGGFSVTISRGITLHGTGGEGTATVNLKDCSVEITKEKSLGSIHGQHTISSTNGTGKSIIGMKDSLNTCYMYGGLSTSGYTMGMSGATGMNSYCNVSMSLNPNTIATIAIVAIIGKSAAQNFNQIMRSLIYEH